MRSEVPLARNPRVPWSIWVLPKRRSCQKNTTQNDKHKRRFIIQTIIAISIYTCLWEVGIQIFQIHISNLPVRLRAWMTLWCPRARGIWRDRVRETGKPLRRAASRPIQARPPSFLQRLRKRWEFPWPGTHRHDRVARMVGQAYSLDRRRASAPFATPSRTSNRSSSWTSSWSCLNESLDRSPRTTDSAPSFRFSIRRNARTEGSQVSRDRYLLVRRRPRRIATWVQVEDSVWRNFLRERRDVDCVDDRAGSHLPVQTSKRLLRVRPAEHLAHRLWLSR